MPAKAAAAVEPVDRAHVVDEFGELARKVRAFAPVKERHEELRKLILGWYDDAPADKPFLEEGERYNVQISPRGKQRSIVNIRKLVKKLGTALFWSIAKVNLTDVDAHLSVTDQVGLIEESQTGPRRIEAVLRFAKRK